jgi:hypothetical protein
MATETTVQQHFVTFYSPGTFVAETTEKPIDAWDVDAAVRMAAKVKERYGATPYGFQFSTRTRGPKDLDSREVKRSPMHYINCKVETLAQIKRRGNPKDRILIENMEGNKWDRVVTSIKGWAWTAPLNKDDVVIEAQG